MKVPFRYSGGLAAGALLVVVIGCGGEEPAPVTQGTGLEAARPSRAAQSCDSDARTLAPDTEFFLRKPDDGAISQFRGLIKSREFVDAVRLGAMESAPQAVWFTDGSPARGRGAVRKTMREAAREGRVPVLVAYNIPFRDCAQYSAGGAVDTPRTRPGSTDSPAASATGGGRHRRAGRLGIIPYNTTIFGAAEWCMPTVTDAEGNVTPRPGPARPSGMRRSITRSTAWRRRPRARAVYLDGTHSAWLGVGEAAYRLFTAGVQRAQGFFVNVSNYETTGDNTQFGTWVSDCITAATAGAPWAAGHFDWCPSQYDPATNYAP